MARGSGAANTASTSAQGLSNQTAGNAQSLYGNLAPALEGEVAHPAGYAPTDLAAMHTAAQQATGGANAAAVGQGSLLASRTRNAGAAQNAVAQSARNAGQTLSQQDVGIQAKNAGVKQQQQQAGLSGLEGLYGQNLGTASGALGQVANNVNASTNAENASWDWSKDLFAPILGAASGGAGAYLGAGKGKS